MSLRNISLENYSYEMLKTHYHELFITTRTSIQDPSIRPQGGNRSNTFFIIEQGEYEGEEGFWLEDEEGLEGFMSNNDLAERPIWPMRTMIPTTRHIGEKAKERRERKEHQNSNIPMMETRVIHPMRMAKEKAGMTRENPRRSQPSQRRRRSSPPSSRLHHPQSLPMPVGQTKIVDQSWTWNEQGWYTSRETSSTGQALMAFHDTYEHHEKEAIHGKLIQSDAVSEHNLSVTTNHSLLATKLMAPVINPQHNPTYAILDNGCTRSMGSWHAIQRFTQPIEPMKDIISYQYIPAETKFTLQTERPPG